MNTIDRDDPRLTAYALGEMEAAEAEAFAAQLEAAPEARSEVEAIRGAAALLEKEFGATPAEAFSPSEREEVLAAAKVAAPGPDAFSRFSRWAGIVGVAACLTVVSAIGIKQFIDTDRQLAREADSVEAGAPAPRLEQGDDPELSLPPPEGEPGELVDEERTVVRNQAEAPAGAEAAVATRAALGSEVAAGGARRDAGRGSVGSLEPAADPLAMPAPDAAPALDAAAAPPPPITAAALTESAPGEPESAPRAIAGRARELKKAEANTLAMAPQAPTGGAVADAFGGIGGTGMGAGGFADGLGGAVGGERDAVGRSASRRRAVVPPGNSEAGPDEATRGIRPPAVDGEDYDGVTDLPFLDAFRQPLSTFAVDVDTASYSNARRYLLRRGQLPPRDAVRVEEMVNYFDYDYPQPEGEHPFAVDLEVASCPWAAGHRLVRVGVQGKSMAPDERPPSNLVFLIDVSGSMRSEDKLPLLKKSMAELARALNEDDRIGIVVYAGKAEVAMEPKHGDQKEEIVGVIESLQAGGSTNGAGGIEMAYRLAKENFVEGGTNRVVLATDGDFNVGTTDTEELVDFVKARAAADRVHLTVLGFGEGNLQDARMEAIANRGDGNYFYIDGEREGRRVLVDKLSATLVTIAKDVKVQVDFNPGKVAAYRLIGYENRMMAAKDFRDDTKDAGEIGAGHSVTALYEIVPVGAELAAAERAQRGETSRYVKAPPAGGEAGGAGAEVETAVEAAREAALVPSEDLLTVALRYKAPDAGPGDAATEFAVPLRDAGKDWSESGEDFRFAAAVAGFGMTLRDSQFRGDCNPELVLELAEEGIGEDPNGLRAEFVEMVERARALGGSH